jgi:hypothetical protein
MAGVTASSSNLRFPALSPPAPPHSPRDGKDDLRKDARMMDLYSMVNRFLKDRALTQAWVPQCEVAPSRPSAIGH